MLLVGWSLMASPPQSSTLSKNTKRIYLHFWGKYFWCLHRLCFFYFPVFFFFVLVLPINVYHSLKQCLDAGVQEWPWRISQMSPSKSTSTAQSCSQCGDFSMVQQQEHPTHLDWPALDATLVFQFTLQLFPHSSSRAGYLKHIVRSKLE